jgi:DNA-binding winged helix-turn-helix (wHTH) protein/Flp pilus assembly protein TadD
MTADADAFEFGPFRLDRRARVLWRGGALEALPPRALDLLAALAERPGDVATKAELMARVWPDVVVEEANLSVQVSTLRKALGTRDDGRSWIETVPRRGYRLAATARRAAELPPRVAVLPLRLIGPPGDDSGEAYLGVALADALVGRLTASGRLIVRPTRAVLKYAAGDVDPERAGRELGVEAVLDGSVQLRGGRLRVSLNLVPCPAPGAPRGDGRALPPWSRTFEVPFTGLFDVQDTVAAQVTRALLPSLEPAPAASAEPRRPTDNPAAYQAYLRGRYFWSRLSGPWLHKACNCFAEAAALDPGFALPHAGLAQAWVLLGFSGLLRPREAWELAAGEAAQALERDEALPEALVARAFVDLLRDWDWPGAARDLAAALALSPQDAAPVLWHGLFLALRGELDGAARALARAEDLDPTSQLVSAARGFVACVMGDHEAELEQQRRTLELDPGQFLGHWSTGLALLHAGRVEEAVAAHRRASELSSQGVLMCAVLGYTLAHAGDTAAARAVLDELRGRAPDYDHPYQQATLHLALGDRAAALACLERACDERDPWVLLLAVDPMLAPLEGEPQLAELRRRVFADRAPRGR